MTQQEAKGADAKWDLCRQKSCMHLDEGCKGTQANKKHWIPWGHWLVGIFFFSFSFRIPMFLMFCVIFFLSGFKNLLREKKGKQRGQDRREGLCIREIQRVSKIQGQHFLLGLLPGRLRDCIHLTPWLESDLMDRRVAKLGWQPVSW